MMTAPDGSLSWTTIAQTSGVIVQSFVALLTVYLAWRTASTGLADRSEHRRSVEQQGWITLAAVLKMGDSVNKALKEPDSFKRNMTMIPISQKLEKIDPGIIASITGATGFVDFQTLVERLVAEGMGDDPTPKYLQAATAEAQELKAAMEKVTLGMQEIRNRLAKSGKL